MFAQFYIFLNLQIVIVHAGDLYSKFNQNDYKVEFTRLELVDYDKEFYENFKVVTFKYNRSVAVANITFKTKAFIDHKDTQIRGQVYKFYSNEYRLFPLRLQLNYCKAVANNVLGMITKYASCGNFSTCNLEKGLVYHLCNWSGDQKIFSPLMPSGQYKLEIALLINNTVNVMYNNYGRVFRPLD